MTAERQTYNGITPAISVIVPVYNGEAYIETCIRSLFAQTETNLEILVLDDASTDASLQCIEELVRECPAEMNLRVFRHEQNGGVAVARNRGVAAARGKYLYFIDCDDWISPDCLKTLLRLAEQHNADVCCGSHILYENADGEKREQPVALNSELYATNDEILQANAYRKIPVFTWNKLIRRELFSEGNLHFEESITNDEDQLWCFRLVMRAKRWVSSDLISYYYRQDNPESITSQSVTERRLNNYYKVQGLMWMDVSEPRDWSAKQKKLIAQTLLNFTKSILWHIELEGDKDFRALYAEFTQRNVFTRKNWISRYVGLKGRCYVYGWSFPYPIKRWFNPSFLVR